MSKFFKRTIVVLLIPSLFVFPNITINGRVQARDFYPPTLEPSFSADALALYNAVVPLVMVADGNPDMQGIKIPPAPQVERALVDPASASATFSITYLAAGLTDRANQVCAVFPDVARTAFNAAAAIWANAIQSTVPITIQACWASLSSSNILGYSGWQPLRRDFSGAPQPATWYEGALANTLYGADLDPASFDMYITYNSNFAWYFGTDSNPPKGQYDLVTVAAHEIAHGLNFSGSADYSSGPGQYGLMGYPFIYDRFIEDNAGTKLTAYPTPSVALGSLLTSNSLWFNGSNANAANGGMRVKIYAPTTWSDGSSYAHLDYDTFKITPNSMMVYAIGSGSANHNPGPVTLGLLEDLGWTLAANVTPPLAPIAVSATDGTFANKVQVSWAASSDASSYQVYRNTSDSAIDAALLGSVAASPYNDTTAVAVTNYWYFVKACNSGGCSDFSLSDSGYRAIPSRLYLPLVIR